MRMVKRSKENATLLFRSAFNSNSPENVFPGSFRLAPHGVEVPTGNLTHEVGVGFLRTDKRDANFHLHALILRRIESYIRSDLAFISCRNLSRLNAVISPRTRGVERSIELGRKMDGIRRLIPS